LQTAEAWLARWQAARPQDSAWSRWLASSGGGSRALAAKELTWALVAGVVLCLCNPNGVRSMLYPWVLRRVLWGSGIAWDLGEFATPSPLSNLPLVLLGLLLALAFLR